MRLIDADVYIEKVCTYKETGCGSCVHQSCCPVDEPTVEAVPVVHGEWIIKTDEYEFAKWDECSICGHKLKAIGCGKDFNFCPNCGADMRKKV